MSFVVFAPDLMSASPRGVSTHQSSTVFLVLGVADLVKIHISFEETDYITITLTLHAQACRRFGFNGLSYVYVHRQSCSEAGYAQWLAIWISDYVKEEGWYLSPRKACFFLGIEFSVGVTRTQWGTHSAVFRSLELKFWLDLRALGLNAAFNGLL